jgi:hypothetical protein
MFRMLLQIVATGVAVSFSIGALWVGLCYACEAVSYVKRSRLRGLRHELAAAPGRRRQRGFERARP